MAVKLKTMKKIRCEKSKKTIRMLLICALLLAAAGLLSMCAGSVRLNLSDIFRYLTDGAASPEGRILMYIRLPRTLSAILAGSSLAVSGVIIQTVLSNPLASPGIIGVNAGAGLAVTLCGAFWPLYPQLLPAAAFLGGFAAVAAVYGMAHVTGASRMTFILSGVAVSSLATAIAHTLTTVFPDALSGAHDFQVGDLAGITPQKLMPAGIYIITGLFTAYLFNRDLDILGLGAMTAKSLGLNVTRSRLLFLLLAAVLAGAAVSFAGLIGFVGLIVPHAGRFLVGGESRPLLLISALMGAVFLTVCDIIARTAFSPYELPTGLLIAFIGTPFFLWLLFKKKGGRHD
jgi:iron complex transport system permease protein